MRGYLPAWSVRLLPSLLRVPSRAVLPLPRREAGQMPAERLEVLERLEREERRGQRPASYAPARRLY